MKKKIKENYKLKKKNCFLKAYLKMEKTITKFDDIEIEKQNFHQHKKQTSEKIYILIKW